MPPSHHQTRKSILFVCLPWHPFLLRSGFFLSPYPSWHAPSGSNSTCLIWVVSHRSRTPPQKSLSWNLKNRFFPSPHHQTMPSKSLTPDLTMLCIGWVQVGGVWALRVPSFHMCPKSICCLFVCRGLEACLHSLPSVFFDLLCGLLFDFPLLLGAGLYLMMSLIFLWPTSWFPSFPTILFCYSCCNDLILLGFFRPAVYSFSQ